MLGLAVPAYFTVVNAAKASRGEINWLVITGALGVAAVFISIALDAKGRKVKVRK